MAVNRRYQVNGEWQEQTSFFNVVAWGTLGENAAAKFLIRLMQANARLFDKFGA